MPATQQTILRTKSELRTLSIVFGYIGVASAAFYIGFGIAVNVKSIASEGTMATGSPTVAVVAVILMFVFGILSAVCFRLSREQADDQTNDSSSHVISTKG